MQSLSPKTRLQLSRTVSGKRYRQFAIESEKHLLTREQSEGLKERGLTVFDAIVGNYTEADVGFINEIKTDWNAQMGYPAFKLEGWSD